MFKIKIILTMLLFFFYQTLIRLENVCKTVLFIDGVYITTVLIESKGYILRGTKKRPVWVFLPLCEHTQYLERWRDIRIYFALFYIVFRSVQMSIWKGLSSFKFSQPKADVLRPLFFKLCGHCCKVETFL